MLPGENIQQTYTTNIRGFDIQYNPYLYGCDHIAYSARSYDQAHPRVVNQLLKYPIHPWLVTFLCGPEWAMGTNEPPEVLGAFRDYRKSIVDLCRDGRAAVHHPLDFDYDRWLEVKNDSVSATLYAREAQALLVTTTEFAPVNPFALRVNLRRLGWHDRRVAVSDNVTGKPLPHVVRDDWLEIRDLEISEWPRLVSISRK